MISDRNFRKFYGKLKRDERFRLALQLLARTRKEDLEHLLRLRTEQPDRELVRSLRACGLSAQTMLREFWQVMFLRQYRLTVDLVFAVESKGWKIGIGSTDPEIVEQLRTNHIANLANAEAAFNASFEGFKLACGELSIEPDQILKIYHTQATLNWMAEMREEMLSDAPPDADEVASAKESFLLEFQEAGFHTHRARGRKGQL